MHIGRQAQIVGLIRTLLLKRFESSAIAFQSSCEDLLLKLLYFVEIHSAKIAQRWKDQHVDLLARIDEHVRQRWNTGNEEDFDEDVIPEEFKKKIEKLNAARIQHRRNGDGYHARSRCAGALSR